MASITDFIKARTENPVWTVAWTGFLGLLYFLWTSISVIPEQSTQLTEYSVQTQKAQAEISRAKNVTGLMVDAVSKAVGAEHDFEARTEQQGRIVIPSIESAQAGLESLEDARKTLMEDSVLLETIPFENQKIIELVNAFDGDLKTLDERLIFRETFYKDVIAGHANTGMIRNRAVNPETERRLYAALARTEAYKYVVSAMEDELQAQKQKSQTAADALHFRVYATGGATLLAGGFIGVALSRWNRERKKKLSAQKPPDEKKEAATA
jgi:hypothetical protein